MHYQPIVNLLTESIHGVEALVRWNHPGRGLLAPSEFLAAAEESGEIVALDRWVLETAARQVHVWQETGRGPAGLRAFVNLSASRLRYPGLAQEVRRTLEASGLSPSDLVMELTETTPVQNMEAAAVELRALKEMGVTLALDDIGTGYSALNHLAHLPVEMIKIDRFFVGQMGEREPMSGLALALLRFADSLGLLTVAEGIEERDQLDTLRVAGCKLGQGYLFSRPLPPQEVEALFFNAQPGPLLATRAHGNTGTYRRKAGEPGTGRGESLQVVASSPTGLRPSFGGGPAE